MSTKYDFLEDVYTTIAEKYQEASGEDETTDGIRQSPEYLMEFIEVLSKIVDVTKTDISMFIHLAQHALQYFETMETCVDMVLPLYDSQEDIIEKLERQIYMVKNEEGEINDVLEVVGMTSKEYVLKYMFFGTTQGLSFNDDYIEKLYLTFYMVIVIMLYLEFTFVAFFE